MNDPSLNQQERLDTPGQLIESKSFPEWVAESNNHIHTYYSFNPYTPTAVALNACCAELRVVGSVGHDSITAAPEMTAACRVLSMGSVTGSEIHAALDSKDPLSTRKLNNPDPMRVAYMTVQGVPARAREEVGAWLAPKCAARLERVLKMAEVADKIPINLGLAPFDPDKDTLAISQYANGGGITERHLLAAMASTLIKGFDKGPQLLEGLKSMGIAIPLSLEQALSSKENPHLMYDLLGVLKAEYLECIYIQPSDGLPSAEEVVAFADSIGAITTYAYLGDVLASPTEDKKAEKFEDEFLDELFDAMEAKGLRAVTYMPPRNTPEQLKRVHELAAAYGMLETSGVDINQPRRSFNYPELRQLQFRELNEVTWALVAHEALMNISPNFHLLGKRCLSPEGLAARIAAYAPLGRAIVDGADPAEIAKTAALL